MSDNIEEKRIAADILIAAIGQGDFLTVTDEDNYIENKADLLGTAFRIILENVMDEFDEEDEDLVDDDYDDED